MAKKSFVDWLYTTAPGRVTLKVLLHTGALKLGEIVARSPLSKPFISRYIKNNNIDMSDFKGQKYNSFQDFFSRKRDDFFPLLGMYIDSRFLLSKYRHCSEQCQAHKCIFHD